MHICHPRTAGCRTSAWALAVFALMSPLAPQAATLSAFAGTLAGYSGNIAGGCTTAGRW